MQGIKTFHNAVKTYFHFFFLPTNVSFKWVAKIRTKKQSYDNCVKICVLSTSSWYKSFWFLTISLKALIHSNWTRKTVHQALSVQFHVEFTSQDATCGSASCSEKLFFCTWYHIESSLTIFLQQWYLPWRLHGCSCASSAQIFTISTSKLLTHLNWI